MHASFCVLLAARLTVRGEFLGIDFGYAFGSATQFLPVPELAPIRLTKSDT